jgi:hypothetical protein
VPALAHHGVTFTFSHLKDQVGKKVSMNKQNFTKVLLTENKTPIHPTERNFTEGYPMLNRRMSQEILTKTSCSATEWI